MPVSLPAARNFPVRLTQRKAVLVFGMLMLATASANASSLEISANFVLYFRSSPPLYNVGQGFGSWAFSYLDSSGVATGTVDFLNGVIAATARSEVHTGTDLQGGDESSVSTQVQDNESDILTVTSGLYPAGTPATLFFGYVLDGSLSCQGGGSICSGGASLTTVR